MFISIKSDFEIPRPPAPREEDSPSSFGQIVCYAESKNRKILLLSDQKTAMKCFALHLTDDKRFHFVAPKYFSVFYWGTFIYQKRCPFPNYIFYIWFVNFQE